MATYLTNNPDVYNGTSGDDEVYGLDGPDVLKGMGGNDELHGDDGWDWINGGSGVDYMYGGEGNDTFEVGGIYSGNVGGLNSGWDRYYGGDDEDRIRIAQTSGWAWTAIMLTHIQDVEIIENDSTGPGYIYVKGNVDFEHVEQWIDMDAMYGSVNGDTISGSPIVGETIYAGSGNDNVDGRGGDDLIYGEAGHDTLQGGAGNDLIDGGAGNNTLTGGDGVDTFNVSSASDTSTITDFVVGTDQIQFESAIADEYSDLAISDDSGDALVSVGTVAITLTGVDYTTLSSSDFMFV
jgi:Ca2+-binding RTX toxin-like protein